MTMALPPPGDENEAWTEIKAGLSDLWTPEPNPSDTEQALNPILKLLQEDYHAAPEADFRRYGNSSIVVEFEGAEPITWRGIGPYARGLIVRQAARREEASKLLFLGGSIYIHRGSDELLTENEKAMLPIMAWQQQGPILLCSHEKGIPFIVAPGVFCKNARLYLMPVMPLSELREPEFVNTALQQAFQGGVIALERSPGRTETYFVHHNARMTPPIQGLSRKQSGQKFRHI